MGDFYEIFYEDALVAARALDITLTSRSKDANGGGIPMCGVPYHAVDGYIARLVKERLFASPSANRSRIRDKPKGSSSARSSRRLARHADGCQLSGCAASRRF